jgi:hypothetical protein
MTSFHHHQLPVFFPNLFQNHPVLLCESIVEREGLEHDERSEERSKGTSSTTCLVQRV